MTYTYCMLFSCNVYSSYCTKFTLSDCEFLGFIKIVVHYFMMEDSSDSLSDLFKIRFVQNRSATRQTVSPEATGNLSTAHGQSMNTSPGLESSVVLTKKKSTLKGLKQFSSTNLFDSEPSSVCESFTEIGNKRKTKHFRDNSPRLQLSFKDLPECSHVSDGNGEKRILKPLASIVGKENVDVNFDNTVSSISDSVVGKRGGGFWNTFKKTKNTTANATVNIFSHPEGLSDDCASSESEESERGFYIFFQTILCILFFILSADSSFCCFFQIRLLTTIVEMNPVFVESLNRALLKKNPARVKSQNQPTREQVLMKMNPAFLVESQNRPKKVHLFTSRSLSPPKVCGLS